MTIMVKRRKRCSKCNQLKVLEDFSKHQHTRDRRQSWCRACTTKRQRKTPRLCQLDECDRKVFRQGYCSPHFHRLSRYGDPFAGGPYRERRVSTADRKEFVRAYKMEKGCVDCGYNSHWAALDFDHLPGTVKVRDIKSGQQLGWKALLAEIEKCEVVCSNCHRIRTVERRKEVMPENV